MNKKVKFVLFLLVGTAANILITALCLILLFVIYLKFIKDYLPPEAAGAGVPIILIVSPVLAFFIYLKLVKVFMKKNPFGVPGQ